MVFFIQLTDKKVSKSFLLNMTFIDILARNFVHNYMLKNVNLLKKLYTNL